MARRPGTLQLKLPVASNSCWNVKCRMFNNVARWKLNLTQRFYDLISSINVVGNIGYQALPAIPVFLVLLRTLSKKSNQQDHQRWRSNSIEGPTQMVRIFSSQHSSSKSVKLPKSRRSYRRMCQFAKRNQRSHCQEKVPNENPFKNWRWAEKFLVTRAVSNDSNHCSQVILYDFYIIF